MGRGWDLSFITAVEKIISTRGASTSLQPTEESWVSRIDMSLF